MTNYGDGQPCALCGKRDVQILPSGLDAQEFACARCRKYRVSGTALRQLRAGSYSEDAWVLSCITRRAETFSPGAVPLLLTSDNIPRLVADAPRPSSPVDVMNQLLLDLASRYRAASEFSGPIAIPTDDHLIYFLRSPDSLMYALKGLERLGYPQNVGQRQQSSEYTVELTVDGWAHASELERSTVRTWQAFVAMSFDKSLRPAYDQGIEPALVETGYDPFRVDLSQHNGKVDDFIIAELKRSGPVVADFTGHRGGVYFECGYAMGRGTSVIWCCREDDIAQAHFDTRQYNHIVWTDPAELRARLVDRIRATVPYREPTALPAK
jgi:nucleoside 2-deoxyribosyltransferase